jgi:hypothetical protein
MKQKSRLYEITQLRLKRDKSDLINSLISDQSKSIESLSFNLGVLFQAKEIISLKKDLKNQDLYYDTIVEVGKNLEALKTDILKKTGKCPVCGKKTTRQKGDKHEEFCENA